MLKKASRLTALEVRNTIKNGLTARYNSVSAKYVKAPTRKAAVVVKTSVAKTAVERNRLRRLAYTTLKESLPQGVQVVVFLHTRELNPQDIRSLCLKLYS